MTEKEKSEKKKEFEAVKKTAEAHGTLSEDKALKEAEKSEEVSEKMIDKEDKKESEKEEAEKNQTSEKDNRRKTRAEREKEALEESLLGWEPKTKLGSDVKNNVIKDIDQIMDSGKKILEEQIVDTLLNLQTDLIAIGQSKGKFGGGKRRAWRQTQRKTKEGNVATFSTMAVVGDENGHVGVGVGRAKETLPARDKAIRKAKLNLIKVVRGNGSFDSVGEDNNSIPFEIEGKAGSVRIKLMPAPQGTGLVAGNEVKKILRFAGIKDVYSKTFGKKRTTFNLVKACIEALKKTNQKVNMNL